MTSVTEVAPKRTSSLKIVLVLSLTLVCLAWVLWGIDISSALNALLQANWWYFIPMFLGYLVSHLLRSLRLWILLDKQTSYGRVFAINTVGFLAINVMPLRLGEMVRPYLLMEKEGIPLGNSVGAILIERLLDMMMLLLMLLCVAWFVELPKDGIIIEGIDVITVSQRGLGILVAVGITGAVAVVWIGEPIISYLEKLPLGGKIATFARKFREALLFSLFSRPLRALGLLLLSVVVWTITIMAVAMALAAFSIPSGFDVALTTWTITLAGMTAVPTPGFFAIYELCCSEALKIFSVDHDLAVTFAVVLHLGQLIFIATLGSFFILKEGLKLKDISRHHQ